MEGAETVAREKLAKPVVEDPLMRECVAMSLAHEKRKKSFSVSAAKAKRFDEEAAEMRRSRNWSSAEPAHLVSLWAWCYSAVYGIPPELTSKERAHAHALAARLVRDEFSGSTRAAVAFLNWTWNREKGRERWRRENGKGGGSLDWRAQFGARWLLREFRVDQQRTA